MYTFSNVSPDQGTDSGRWQGNRDRYVYRASIIPSSWRYVISQAMSRAINA